jgi:hypothetical protein
VPDLEDWTSQVMAVLSWLLTWEKNKQHKKNKNPDLISMADEGTTELP